MVIAILVGTLILLTSVQPTDAEQEEVPRWELDMREGCFTYEHGRPVVRMDCYRVSCADDGDECTWKWGGGCFKWEGGYCN